MCQEAPVHQRDTGACPALVSTPFPLDVFLHSPGGKRAFVSLYNNDPQLNSSFLTETGSFASFSSSSQDMEGSKYPKYLAVTSIESMHVWFT